MLLGITGVTPGEDAEAVGRRHDDDVAGHERIGDRAGQRARCIRVVRDQAHRADVVLDCVNRSNCTNP